MIAGQYPSKLLRKQKRCQSLVAKDTNLLPSDNPTRYVAICNAGLSTGISEESLLEEVLKYGQVRKIVMIPNKSYCFLDFGDSADAETVYAGMNGKSTLGQNGCVIYMSYFMDIPLVKDYNKSDLPSGVHILTDFISVEEEAKLLKAVRNSLTGSLKNRSVKHFGYEFLYSSNNVDLSKPLEESIPSDCDFLWTRLKDKGPALNWYTPDQLTVNQYMPGHGIPQHVDTHSAFDDPILSLSLESDIVMEFRKNNEKVSVQLPRFSLLILSGEGRYDWTHGISPRTMDIVRTSNNSLTTVKRSRRTSLTFRKTRKGACECTYPKLCDSQQQSLIEPKEFPNSLAQTLEENNVHHIYENIAGHFSETRHSPWPKVSQFLERFSDGSIIFDVGCGNGKYLSANTNRFQIGCDRSAGLLNVCRSKNLNVFRCDCRSVPVRSLSADGVISIAVIHHLANKSRRLESIKEMARILRPGGMGLIYVWAKNQCTNAKKSNYLRQKNSIENNLETPEKPLQNDDTLILENQIRLPIHVNRTEFLHKDILVPWKLKLKENKDDNMTFLRFYHVFEEFELEALCAEVSEIEIQESYYDQGNHCVIFRRK